MVAHNASHVAMSVMEMANVETTPNGLTPVCCRSSTTSPGADGTGVNIGRPCAFLVSAVAVTRCQLVETLPCKHCSAMEIRLEPSYLSPSRTHLWSSWLVRAMSVIVKRSISCAHIWV
jgi:hypothetical protein